VRDRHQTLELAGQRVIPEQLHRGAADRGDLQALPQRRDPRKLKGQCPFPGRLLQDSPKLPEITLNEYRMNNAVIEAI
jgi:hypothetical protein